MKTTLIKILLWTGGFATVTAGINLLGLALFAPATREIGLAEELFTEQLLATLGGRGRVMATAVVCVLICIVLKRLLQRVNQAEGDSRARLLLSEVREDKPPSSPYFLYLRAFETTRNLTAPLFLLNLTTFGLDRLWSGELEGFISTALRKAGPLIALGHPGENFGAGRVTTSDEEWMADIAKLARNARGVLLIPSHRPGTLWEIEHLEREGLLSRTVFMMPPESRRFDWRSHWGQARRAMGELGAALPEYEDLGMLFALDENRAVRGVEPFSLFIRRSLRKSVLKLLGTASAAGRAPGNALGGAAGDPSATNKAFRKAHRKAARWRLWGLMNVWVRALAMAGFGLVALVLGLAAGPPPKAQPWGAFFKEWMNAVEIEDHARRLSDTFTFSPVYSAMARPLSLTQENELQSELTHAGFRRLDNAQLRTAYVAFSQVLQRSDVPTCGAMARDTLPAYQLDRALLKIDLDQLDSWKDMNQEAALAELKEEPLPSFSYSELVEARNSFEQSLKPDELNRYQALTQRDATRTIDDECWLARKKFAAVSSLPEPKNLAWARLLELEREKPVTHALVKDPLGKLKALAAFQQRTHGMTVQQMSDLFGDLVGKGVERLDDAALLARYRALSEVMDKADQATCEAIALGTSSVDQFEQALGTITESGQAGFLDSQYRAALAELRQTKPVVLSKAEIEMASKRFLSTFNPQEMAELGKESADGPEARQRKCWLVRKDFAAVTLLEEPYNRMWARNLAQQ